MSKKNKTTKDYMGQEFVITREFAAPRELVFEAWTDPKHVAQWWGPRGFTNPVCQWNAVKGQAIHVVMRAPDGTDYPMGGEFREIVAPERLVMSCGALNEKAEMLFEFVHVVTFAERGSKTLVTVNSRVTKITAEANKYIGGFEAGMTQSLVRLGEMLDRAGAEALSSTASEREIVISRVFAASRELVWDAMTDPKQVVKWWGPRGFTTTIEEMNVRPGGVWNHVMHGPDGTEYPGQSIFTEVVKPERIVFTHGGGKKGGPSIQFVMAWTFDAVEADKTRLTVRQVYASAKDRDMIVREFGAVEGGKQTLARLGEHLATGLGK